MLKKDRTGGCTFESRNILFYHVSGHFSPFLAETRASSQTRPCYPLVILFSPMYFLKTFRLGHPRKAALAVLPKSEEGLKTDTGKHFKSRGFFRVQNLDSLWVLFLRAVRRLH